MASCKLPCAVFIDQKIARKAGFLTIYSIIYYDKELTCHEAVDLSVTFNQHALSIGIKQHCHFLDHVIFLYI